ncbi:MAG: DUF481 domain-containing protein [Bacteroidales bacterium]
MKTTLLTIAMVLISIYSTGQQPVTSEKDTLRKDALNVYMEASDYIKEQIPFVNYVRDRMVADLIIIKTLEGTGSGGSERTFFLEGTGKCGGMRDTISFSTSPDETYEQIREREAQLLKMGLIRYIMKTPLSDYIDINFSQPIQQEVSSDKWNSWVFRAGMNGMLNGESSYKSSNISGNFSANRVTSDWKININSRYSRRMSEYEIGDDIYTSNTNTANVNALIVKSINEHWSYGGSGSVSSSTYSNYDLSVSIMPGIEYDIYPYSESNRRQLRILYSIGYNYNNYTDTTIYDKTSEGLMVHSLSGSYEVIQKWGSIDMSVSWSNFLRDFSENRLSVFGSLNWRVAKGLSINFGGSYAFVHNQISLVKGGASSEEILLRRRELATSYNYFTHFGFSYTFGSIYNNVVNPRFGGGGGGGMVIIMN